MKVIDLLIKIANGEEVPEKIRYGSKTYHREKTIEDELYYYVLDDDNFTLLIEVIHSFYDLNKIVKIIEDTPKEDKKIEKIDLEFDDGFIKEHFIGSSVSYLSEYITLKMLYEKQCEIIDKMNEGSEENEI